MGDGDGQEQQEQGRRGYWRSHSSFGAPREPERQQQQQQQQQSFCTFPSSQQLIETSYSPAVPIDPTSWCSQAQPLQCPQQKRQRYGHQ